MDEVAGADHLRDQIERDDGERADRGGDAHRALAQAVRDDVGERVLAEVAQRLGDQERDHRPADEQADRVDQAVEARRRDQARDAEEARGAHVVAGEREAVLRGRDRCRRRRRTPRDVRVRRAAQYVMPSVIRTKPRNATIATTLGLPSDVMAHGFLPQRRDRRVVVAVRPPHVDRGEHRREHDQRAPSTMPTLIRSSAISVPAVSLPNATSRMNPKYATIITAVSSAPTRQRRATSCLQLVVHARTDYRAGG